MEEVHKIRYEFSDDNFISLISTWRSLGYRGAIVGPKGHGKSTLLQDLKQKIQAGISPELATLPVSLLKLTEQRRKFCQSQIEELSVTAQQNGIVMLDGAEQLSFWNWRKFQAIIQPCKAAIITTHRPQRMRTVWRCRTTVKLLERILHKLLQEYNFSHPVLLNSCEKLFHKHRGNIRECLREYYDLWAHQQFDHFLERPSSRK